MTDEEALLAAVKASPDDDLPRLVYADWLEERGGADRAEFIRVQCEIANPPDPDICPTCGGRYKFRSGVMRASECGNGHQWTLPDLRRRERDLLLNLAESFQPAPGWCVVTPPGCPRPDWPVWAVARRGFIEEVTCGAPAWLAHGDDLLRRHPVRAVTLTTHPGNADELTIGGLPPGVSWYHVAGEKVVGPRSCAGDPAVLFPLRYPGVSFALPPEPRRGQVFTLPPDFLFRDYTQEGLDSMREAGRRSAMRREERALRAILDPPRGR